MTRSVELAQILGTPDLTVTIQDGNQRVEKRLSSTFLAGVVMRDITRFCQSADPEPEAKHVPYIEGIDIPPGANQNNREVARELVAAMRRGWADITNPRGVLPFRHDAYLKLWQLSSPRINADFILFDEAQDASPVLLDVVAKQTHAQVVWVGDSQQCQPAGTMVLVVKSYRRGNRHTGIVPATYRRAPIESVVPGDRVLTFDIGGSFLRRMGATVERTASHWYEGELIDVKVGEHISSYTPEHRCVVRCGDALENLWCVYAMRRGCSFRVGFVRGVYRHAERPAWVADEDAGRRSRCGLDPLNTSF